MDTILEIGVNILSYRFELEGTMVSLLLYCTVGFVATIIKNGVTGILTWNSYLVVEGLYIIGMVTGLLLSLLPMTAIVTRSIYQKRLKDIEDKHTELNTEKDPGDMDVFE